MWMCPKFWVMTFSLFMIFISNLLIPFPWTTICFLLSGISCQPDHSQPTCIIITVYCIILFLVILLAGKQHHLSKGWAYCFLNSTLNDVHLPASFLFHAWVFMLYNMNNIWKGNICSGNTRVYVAIVYWGHCNSRVLRTYCRINMSPRNCHFQSIVAAFSNIRMNKGDTGSETVRRAPGR